MWTNGNLFRTWATNPFCGLGLGSLGADECNKSTVPKLLQIPGNNSPRFSISRFFNLSDRGKSPWLAAHMCTVCGAYGGLYPNLSRINFLGPSFFRNKFPFPKKGTTPRPYMVHKKYPESILGPWGQTSLDKVPVAKVLFIPCKSPTNSAPRNSTLFFGCKPSVAEYFSMGQPPWTLKIPKLGLNKFPRGIIFSCTGSGKQSCQHEPGIDELCLFLLLSPLNSPRLGEVDQL